MRLLRTRASSLDLIEVGEDRIERQEIRYAILSHRWDADEITFQDIPHLRDNDAKKKTQGYQKVMRFCEKVADHFEYAWIDTCCINKESSTELSEAINSMFRWYKQAGRCYAYLNDVSPSADQGQLYANMRRSQWFERGWTLQELIAPSYVVFLAKDWTEIGCRKSLSALISETTRIDESVLQGDTHLQRFSTAKKMSWASGRVTTRREDIAYCLMGIFDVSMPLLYGEGDKAFIRLQEEIMKVSDDQTLFAWESSAVSSDHPSGLLARSPVGFRNSGNIIPFKFTKETTPYWVTNRGIRLDSLLLRASDVDVQKAVRWTRGVDILALECCDASKILSPKPLGVKLRETPGGHSHFVRVGPSLERNIPLDLLYHTKPTIIYAQKTLVKREYVKSPKVSGRTKNLIICLDSDDSRNTQPKNTTSNIKTMHYLVRGTGDSQVCYYGTVSGNGMEHVKKCAMSAYKVR